MIKIYPFTGTELVGGEGQSYIPGVTPAQLGFSEEDLDGFDLLMNGDCEKYDEIFGLHAGGGAGNRTCRHALYIVDGWAAVKDGAILAVNESKESLSKYAKENLIWHHGNLLDSPHLMNKRG